MKSSLSEKRTSIAPMPFSQSARACVPSEMNWHSSFWRSRRACGSNSAFVLARPSSPQCSSPSWMSSIHAPMYALPMLFRMRSSARSTGLMRHPMVAPMQSCTVTVG